MTKQEIFNSVLVVLEKHNASKNLVAELTTLLEPKKVELQLMLKTFMLLMHKMVKHIYNVQCLVNGWKLQLKTSMKT